MNISNSQVNRLRHFVRAGLRSLFRPEPQTAVEWADANYYLPKESAYQEGRWETLPFQRAIMNAMGSDYIREVNVVKSARVGYSKMLLGVYAYFIEHKQRNTLIPAGFVAVFNSDEASWHLVEDHRGKTVYDVASGDALFISELGPLPENVTWLSPEGEFQKWNGTAWVKDAEAEKLFRIREAEETKNSLMQVASEHIAPLQDAVDLEIATEEETSLLEAWKKYRVLLNRVDTSTAPDIEWPTVPCQGVIIGIMPQHVLSKNVLRLDAIFSLKRKTLLQYLEPWF